MPRMVSPSIPLLEIGMKSQELATNSSGGQEFESLRARHFTFEINNSRGAFCARLSAQQIGRVYVTFSRACARHREHLVGEALV
jgi:hypothetical protein